MLVKVFRHDKDSKAFPYLPIITTSFLFMEIQLE